VEHDLVVESCAIERMGMTDEGSIRRILRANVEESFKLPDRAV
jgi:hypothetical protein